MFLLKSDDAIEFMDNCVSEGLHLYGVEGFFITEQGAHQPTQDYSNDIADKPLLSYESFIKETKKLINEGRKENVWFEVVFSENKMY